MLLEDHAGLAQAFDLDLDHVAARQPLGLDHAAEHDDFAGGVLGTPIADFDPLALDALTGRMTVNGAAAGAGRGGDILGHPLEALAWLANLKAGQGAALAAGEIVMLGSVVETKWLARGDAVEVEIESLGQASVVFE